MCVVVVDGGWWVCVVFGGGSAGQARVCVGVWRERQGNPGCGQMPPNAAGESAAWIVLPLGVTLQMQLLPCE